MVTTLTPAVLLVASQQTPAALLLIALAALATLGRGAATLIPDARSSVDGLSSALRAPAPMTVALILFAGISLFGALSAVWAVAPAESFERSLKLGVVGLATGLVLLLSDRAAAAGRLRADSALAGFSALAVAIVAGRLVDAPAFIPFAVETPGDAVNFFNRPAYFVVLLVWPALVAVRRVNGAWAAPLVAAGAAMAVIGGASPAPTIALALGFVVFAACHVIAPRLIALLLGAGLCVGVAATPIIFSSDSVVAGLMKKVHSASFSARHRVLIWGFSADAVLERPVLGWGLDSSRAIPDGNRPIAETRERHPQAALGSVLDQEIAVAENLPLHPHNVFLQAGLELGLLGALAAAAAAGWLLIRLSATARCRTAAAARLAGAAGALSLMSVSFGSLQTWWLAGLALLALFTITAERGALAREVRAGSRVE